MKGHLQGFVPHERESSPLLPLRRGTELKTGKAEVKEDTIDAGDVETFKRRIQMPKVCLVKKKLAPASDKSFPTSQNSVFISIKADKSSRANAPAQRFAVSATAHRTIKDHITFFGFEAVYNFL